MRKLNEQWVEIIDGQEHLVKLVEGNANRTHMCNGCAFRNEYKNLCEIHGGVKHISEVGCARQHLTIKDLGILNKDGLLPIPFDVPVGYPKYPVINKYSRNIDGVPELFQVSYSHMNSHINFGIYNSEQEAKDAWNRRV